MVPRHSIAQHVDLPAPRRLTGRGSDEGAAEDNAEVAAAVLPPPLLLRRRRRLSLHLRLSHLLQGSSGGREGGGGWSAVESVESVVSVVGIEGMVGIDPGSVVCGHCVCHCDLIHCGGHCGIGWNPDCVYMGEVGNAKSGCRNSKLG